MDTELLRIAGQTAGIAGLFIVTFLIIFRAVIKRGSFNVILTKRQVYELIRLTLYLTWSFVLLGLFGLGLWAYANKIEERRQPPNVLGTPTPASPTPVTPTPVTPTPVTPTPVTPTSGMPTPVTPSPGTPTAHGATLPVTLLVTGYKKTAVCVGPGDRLKITADGTISFGANIRDAGPNGKETFVSFIGVVVAIDRGYKKEETIPFGALLCKLDTDPRWQMCGAQKVFAADAAGCLEFEVNDINQRDNNGDFSVTINSSK